MPVLTSRGTVKIDENLKTIFCCPSDGLEEEAVLPLDIRFAGTDFVSPIPYRNAYMIESKMQDCTGSARTVWSARYKHGAPSSCDCLKVGLGDERIPMI